MGVISYVAWLRAIRGRRLVDDEIGDAELLKITRDIVPEPLTAFITIWVSFLGAAAWEAAWLLVLPIAYIVKRFGRT